MGRRMRGWRMPQPTGEDLAREILTDITITDRKDTFQTPRGKKQVDALMVLIKAGIEVTIYPRML